MEGTNEDGDDRTVVVFDLQGPGSPVPTFEQEVYEAGELVRSLPACNTVCILDTCRTRARKHLCLFVFSSYSKREKNFLRKDFFSYCQADICF